METALHVALSGQMALQRRLDTIANNVANSSTPGFRAENITFDTVMSLGARTPIAFAKPGAATFSSAAGPLTQTGNPLDLAIVGDGFLAVQSPQGTAYTRDGRLQIGPSGTIETISGAAVLDAGGSPLQASPSRGPLQIARNGTVSQDGNRIGVIGLFRLAPGSTIARHEGAAFAADKPAEPVVDFTANGIVQGHVEGSNANPVLEMTRLITVSRTFEQLSASIDQSDRRLSDAIRTLAGSR